MASEENTPSQQFTRKTYLSTHKAIFYTFLPSKADEILMNATRNSPLPYQPPRYLVELRDYYEPPIINPHDRWCIKKKVRWVDIRDGKLMLTFNETFDHIFRYWSFDKVNNVVFGTGKASVEISDDTVWIAPKRYVGDTVYLERGPNGTFFLGWADIVRDRALHAGDEVGVYWESEIFHVKILSRHKK